MVPILTIISQILNHIFNEGSKLIVRSALNGYIDLDGIIHE